MYDQASKSRTVMVCAFDGWNDACQCATDVIHQLVSRYPATEVAHINRDGYYDYQAVRPIQCSIQGYRRILWPQTVFYDIAITDGFHILAQTGPEPNYGWMDYCQESLRIAAEYEVQHIYTLGSMFADCPHTRPLPMEVSINGEYEDNANEYNGPIGIPQVLDAAAVEDGFPTTSLWVSVPKYLGNGECAQGTFQLLGELSRMIGVVLPAAQIEGRAEQWRNHADIILRNNPDLADYVAQLEQEYDRHEQAAKIAAANSPAVEQLVSEAEAFLREMPDNR